MLMLGLRNAKNVQLYRLYVGGDKPQLLLCAAPNGIRISQHYHLILRVWCGIGLSDSLGSPSFFFFSKLKYVARGINSAPADGTCMDSFQINPGLFTMCG